MKRLARIPALRVAIGLLVGTALLIFAFHYVGVGTSLGLLRTHLVTRRGVLLALLSGVAFLGAYVIRGVRWRLFLQPLGRVSAGTAVRIVMVSIFINFLLPIRGGEVVKSLILRRRAGIAISRSLPTVAVDRSLDLAPALVVMLLVPMLGLRMDLRLWAVMVTVSGLLVIVAGFVALSAWQRATAVAAVRSLSQWLPGALATRIEASAAGLVDSLLIAASRPRVFMPAAGLTCAAVLSDGLFAALAFWTVGVPVAFPTVLFGYTVYNLFYIAPTPPGQIGSNEAVGLLVFSGLLHLPASGVLAMFIFSHSWAALLMCTTGLICLQSFSLTLSGVRRAQNRRLDEAGRSPEAGLIDEALSGASKEEGSGA